MKAASFDREHVSFLFPVLNPRFRFIEVILASSQTHSLFFILKISHCGIMSRRAYLVVDKIKVELRLSFDRRLIPRGQFSSKPLFCFLRVYDRNRRDVYDLLDFRSALQYMHGFRHPHQDRTDRLRSTNPRQQLVASVG
jgi:hypothetical protein